MNFKEALEAAVKEYPERGTPFLIEEYLPEDWDIEEIYDRIVGSRRWEEDHEAVYKHDGRYWMVDYAAPATEMQEWESYRTTVYEVEPYEVTVTKYRKVEA